jgi:predicted RNase H-like HicB family nuclease
MTKRQKHNASKPEATIEYNFTVFFEPAVEGGYVVTCPALPGLVTEGDTLAEARRMARDAIRVYLESLRKDGESIPRDPRLTSVPVKEKIKVAIPA